MSASNFPATFTSPSKAAATPREKLLPVRLVKTFNPVDSSSSTTILVVVVLPLVPLITTMPWGKSLSVRAINLGSIFSTTSPGSAEPPPRKLAANFTDFPINVVMICLGISNIIQHQRTRAIIKSCFWWEYFSGGTAKVGCDTLS